MKGEAMKIVKKLRMILESNRNATRDAAKKDREKDRSMFENSVGKCA